MKHLLSCKDLTKVEAVGLLDKAAQFKVEQVGNRHNLTNLAGKTVVNLFYEDSTRTRFSFETAIKRLGANVVNFSAKGSSVSKGESLKDTAQTLESMGIDAIVIRHQHSGAPHLLATSGWVDVPVVNAGDGMHQHPTQALLDAFTIREVLVGGRALGHQLNDASSNYGFDDADRAQASIGKDLAGIHVAIVGDSLHSRVVRSNVELLTLLGANVTLVGPPTLFPVVVQSENQQAWNCQIAYDFDEVLAGKFGKVDAVMMLRIQEERMLGGSNGSSAGYFPSISEYVKRYGMFGARFDSLSGDQIILHPAPINRGLEISARAADSERSVIAQQIANGVVVRMAVLDELIGEKS